MRRALVLGAVASVALIAAGVVLATRWDEAAVELEWPRGWL